MHPHHPQDTSDESMRSLSQQLAELVEVNRQQLALIQQSSDATQVRVGWVPVSRPQAFPE